LEMINANMLPKQAQLDVWTISRSILYHGVKRIRPRIRWHANLDPRLP
jgi:hypothetical protein